MTRLTLNIQQACDRAGCSKRTMYYWVKAGKVEAVRTPGGKLRIVAESLFTPVTPNRQPAA